MNVIHQWLLKKDDKEFQSALATKISFMTSPSLPSPTVVLRWLIQTQLAEEDASRLRETHAKTANTDILVLTQFKTYSSKK